MAAGKGMTVAHFSGNAQENLYTHRRRNRSIELDLNPRWLDMAGDVLR